MNRSLLYLVLKTLCVPGLLFTSGCKQNIFSPTLDVKKSTKIIESVHIFESNEQELKQADSVANLLLKAPNNQENRDLLGLYMANTRPDKTWMYALIDKSQQANDIRNLANAHNALGVNFETAFELDSALTNYTKAYVFYEHLQDSAKIFEVLLHQGIVFLNNSYTNQAEKALMNALDYQTTSQDTSDKYKANLILGNALLELGQNKLAHEHILKAIYLLSHPDILLHYKPTLLRANQIMANTVLIESYLNLEQYQNAIDLSNDIIGNYLTLEKEDYRDKVFYA